MKNVVTILQNGNYFAEIDGGPKFFVGKRVQFQGNKGLMNIVGKESDRYDNTKNNNVGQDVWADIIYPTAVSEGCYFHTLNTYDRARFTFGFLQYAAHVPNGDFVNFFRALLSMTAAKEYFPDLTVVGGRITKISDTGNVQMENDRSTEALMKYLNPTSDNIEDTEVIQSAKFVDWASTAEHRSLQINSGKELFKNAMTSYDHSYGLDGRHADVCIVVADIRHHGRGSGSDIRFALSSGNPYEALLAVGENKYPERVRTLRREIDKLMENPTFANRTYRRQSRDFA